MARNMYTIHSVTLKNNYSEFLQNKYFDGVHKSFVLCIHTASSDKMDR